MLCIAQAEVSSLLSLPCIAEGLLNFKYGPELICRLVANAPDSFTEGLLFLMFFFSLRRWMDVEVIFLFPVYQNFILNGPKQEDEMEADVRRGRVLKMMCKMSPPYALVVRAFAVSASLPIPCFSQITVIPRGFVRVLYTLLL